MIWCWLRSLFVLEEDLSKPPVLPRVQQPRRRGRTPAQRLEDDADYARQIRENFAITASFERRRAGSIGCTHFIWRSVGDVAVCPTCRRNNGKRFSLTKVPASGFPGEVKTCCGEWCRCTAEPVIPDIDPHPRRKC